MKVVAIELMIQPVAAVTDKEETARVAWTSLTIVRAHSLLAEVPPQKREETRKEVAGTVVL